MIAKELDPHSSKDPKDVSGRKAEEQVAFYLRRGFADDQDAQVLNGLRLEAEGDACQMDHLVVHRNGIVIVESKSVTSKVKINGRGEWRRLWDGHWHGMASPIQQAKLQAEFLRARLRANEDALLIQMPGEMSRRGFGNFDIAVLVAISDRGIVEREQPDLEPDVVKADQIVEKVRQMMSHQKKLCGMAHALFALRPRGVELAVDEVRNVLGFLVAAHRPKSAPGSEVSAGNDDVAVVVPSSIATKPSVTTVLETPPPAGQILFVANAQASKLCRHCASSDVTVEHGKYGYYLKCGSCQGNTPIDVTLPGGDKGRIRKQGKHFFLVAPDGSERLYHVNP